MFLDLAPKTATVFSLHWERWQQSSKPSLIAHHWKTSTGKSIKSYSKKEL
jgi:hypothetical protein